jgi:hypothetical protein
MRAALYLRVSTDGQTCENQERELRASAARMGHEVVAVYRDDGISGARGRDRRPGFDALHRDIARRKFELVMAWSVCRLGRSLRELLPFPQRYQPLGDCSGRTRWWLRRPRQDAGAPTPQRGKVHQVARGDGTAGHRRDQVSSHF